MPTIQDLPNELLLKIFLWGTCNWATLNGYSLPFPVTASGVCTLWRTLALNAPTLWNFIVVPFFQPHIDAETWTSYWIEKSQPYPIHMYLDLPATSSGFPETNVMVASYGVITLIANNMARIRMLEITSVPFASPSVLLGPLAGASAPTLEDLHISFYGKMPSQITFGGTKLLRDSSKLSTVHLQGVTVLLPQTNLTHLTLHHALMLHEDMRCLFSTCPELSHLVLPALIYVHDIPDHEIANINASSLRYLAVSFSDGNVTRPRSTPLEYLIIPNVEYLEIDSGVFDSMALKRSLNPKKIRTLRLSNFTQDVFSVGQNTHSNVKFVQSFINLENLQLNRFVPPDKEDVINNSSSSADHIWPALSIISMDTIASGQVAHLCRFVATHPGVRLVKLSHSTKGHLLNSVQVTGPGRFRAVSMREKAEALELFEWLKSRVEVIYIHGNIDGLIEKSYQYTPGFPRFKRTIL